MAIASHPEATVKCEQNIRKAYTLRSSDYRRGWGSPGERRRSQGISRDVIAQRAEQVRARLLDMLRHMR